RRGRWSLQFGRREPKVSAESRHLLAAVSFPFLILLFLEPASSAGCRSGAWAGASARSTGPHGGPGVLVPSPSARLCLAAPRLFDDGVGFAAHRTATLMDAASPRHLLGGTSKRPAPRLCRPALAD